MSLNETIDDFKTGPDSGEYTVTRTADGTWVKSKAVPGSSSTFIIVASVQPTDGLKIDDAPEGQASFERKLLLTTTKLKTRRGPSDPSAPDFVTIDSEQWRVDEVCEVDHGDGLEIHYECIVTRYNLP